MQDVTRYHTPTTSAEHEQVALEAARKAMTLLQNEPDTSTQVRPAARQRNPQVPRRHRAKRRPAAVRRLRSGRLRGADGGGGPINNNVSAATVGLDCCRSDGRLLRTAHVLCPRRHQARRARPQGDLRAGVPIDDYDANATYYTTIQAHFTTQSGEPGIIGKYYKTADHSGTPALTRNDYMISFHLLNYGPGQSEADPSVFPESAFSSVHEGFLTPDCTVSRTIVAATSECALAECDNSILPLLPHLLLRSCQQRKQHRVRAGVGRDVLADGARGDDYKLMIDGKLVLSSDPESPHVAVDVVQGKKMAIRFGTAAGQHRPAPVVVAAVVAPGRPPAAGRNRRGVGQRRHGLRHRRRHLRDLRRGRGPASRSPRRTARLSAGRPTLRRCKRRSLAVVVVQGKAFAEPWMKQALPAILEACPARPASPSPRLSSATTIRRPRCRHLPSLGRHAARLL